MITITVPWVPPAALRGNSRAHWATKHAWTKVLRESGYFYGRMEDRAIQEARITYRFHHWRYIDLDNLAIGMKPFVDGLCAAGLLAGDGPRNVVYGQHAFFKGKRGSAYTTIEIEEL